MTAFSNLVSIAEDACMVGDAHALLTTDTYLSVVGPNEFVRFSRPLDLKRQDTVHIAELGPHGEPEVHPVDLYVPLDEAQAVLRRVLSP